jgi:hypothetical protein
MTSNSRLIFLFYTKLVPYLQKRINDMKSMLMGALFLLGCLVSVQSLADFTAADAAELEKGA